MKYNPNRHHRRSTRLKAFDYSSAGAYFITICTLERECVLSEILNGESVLSKAGLEVARVWDALPERFPTLELDEFVVMPNHIHGIMVLEPSGAEGAASSAPTIGEMMRAFKSLSGIGINRALGRSGRPAWQRNYHDRVIRDERELENTRRYILENPLNWLEDDENPARL